MLNPSPCFSARPTPWTRRIVFINIKVSVSSIDDLLAIVDLLTKPIVVPAGYVLVSKKDWVTATDIIMLADQMLRMYQHPKTRRIMADGYTFNQEDNFDERCDALVDGSVVHPYWIGD